MSRDTKILMRPDVAAVGVDAVAVAGSAASDSDGRAARAMDSLRRVVRSLHDADANKLLSRPYRGPWEYPKG